MEAAMVLVVFLPVLSSLTGRPGAVGVTVRLPDLIGPSNRDAPEQREPRR